ncbi:hypothetical protein WJX84_001417 [Apatococcus fuscideae]|uniref:Bro-N domain-containing protein n=1 Tax=Apatococcus fuscideae TaxID=2026836 RepID=A0AAW1T799_9CHLO
MEPASMSASLLYDPESSTVKMGQQQIPVVAFAGDPHAPWFKAKPLVLYLEYKNITTTLDKVDDGDKCSLRELLDAQGVPLGVVRPDLTTPSYHDAKALWVNEFGLYDLIMGSDKAGAKALKRWVTHDLLPTLRKTGHYTIVPPRPSQVPPELTEWHRQRDEGREATKRAGAAIREATGNRAGGYHYAQCHDATNWAATGHKTKALKKQLGIRGTPRDHMPAPQLSIVAYVEAMASEKVGRKRLLLGADVAPCEAVREVGVLANAAHGFTRATGGHALPMLARRPPTTERYARALEAPAPTKRQRAVLEDGGMRAAPALPPPDSRKAGLVRYLVPVPLPTPVAPVPLLPGELDLYD